MPYELVMDIPTLLMRLSISAVLGGLVGWERERRNKQAGLKTHLLVAVGSTLIMLTSIYGFDPALLGHPNARFDPGRIAAQVVSGIGFLGAGAIMRRSDNVISGLTTAATLWIVAAVGLAVGSGFYVPAAATTVIVLFSTMLLTRLESRFIGGKRSGSLRIVMATDTRSDHVQQVTALLEHTKLKVEKFHIAEDPDETDKRRLTFEYEVYGMHAKTFNTLLERLWELEGMRDIRMNWRE